MKTIYLCGAINGCSDQEAKGWREYAKIKLGNYNILDPMRRDFRGIEDANVENIVAGDYEDIYDSDIILVAADKPSWGTAMEIHQAYMQNKVIITVCSQERISPWLRYHSTAIYKTLDEAIARLTLTTE